MEQANRLYRQYLEDARNLAKVGQDALTLQKAEVFAKIATAIAATGFVEASIFEEENTAPEPRKVTGQAPTGKASLERTPEPKKVVGTAKVEVPAAPDPEPVPEWLDSKEFAALEHIYDEPDVQKDIRIQYLLKTYGPKQMKQLPPEVFPYFHLEGNELKDMKYYLTTWNEDPEKWTIKAATEISNNCVTAISDLTVEDYLTKLMPAVYHMNYILSFEKDQHAELLRVLGQVSKGTVKKIDDLRFRNIEFIHVAVDSVIDGTFDEIEKVS